MKAGVNHHDKILIKRMAERGDPAEDISRTLQIVLSAVESFMPVKHKRKKKAAPKAEVEQVESD